MDNPWVVLLATAAIIAASAFFVAVEFALLAARRHRLEEEAASSRAARAALRSSAELTVLLAGSQLGITICTLALGAITKPAVHHWLTPLVAASGLAAWVADVIGFVLALVVVTFLHLVVGEMAPKSWAIADPERSAILLSVPMRAFMALTRPLLRTLNEMANWCLRRVGVEPVDATSLSATPDELRYLVDHSVETGVLEAEVSAPLTAALALSSREIRDLAIPTSAVAMVAAGATVTELQRAGLDQGHLRVLVTTRGRPTGFVHLRDTLNRSPRDRLSGVIRPLRRLPADMTVADALTRMKGARAHLVMVTAQGEDVGVLTLEDVLQTLA